MSLLRFGVVGAIAAAGMLASTLSASAITYELNIISNANIGAGSQGSVTLTQVNANQVDVDVVLTAGVLLVNTGGPHTPFVFNLAPSVAGATVTVTSVNTPATFFVQAGPQSATPYGSFANAIGYNGSNGGVGHGSAGPLEFSVVFAGGISVSDFIANAGGYFFAADVYGTGGNTGSVASNAACLTCPPNNGPGETPIPGAAFLMGSVLAGGAGFGAWRRRRREKFAA